jgi:hypothetical protein
MAQKLSRSNRKIVGIRIKPKEGMWINYQFKLRGITHQKLADQIGLKRESITKVVNGARHSTKVENALFQALGFSSFESMIAAARGKGDAV